MSPVNTNPSFLNMTAMYLRQFMVIFLPVLSVLLVGVFFHYLIYAKAEKDKLERNDLLNIKLSKIALTNVLDEVTSDLMYLRQHNENRNAFTYSKLAKTMLEQDFAAFAKNRKVYSQIRFINTQGEEIVRVNYDSGKTNIIGRERLQKKNKRYYVTKTLSLEKNEIYWSPFDLNIENGEIEIPYKPTMRIGTPVFNHQGKRTGVLIFNFDGKKILSEFRRSSANIGDHVMLLNKSGYWLSGQEPELEWGFMFNNFNSFALKHPDEWQQINSTNKTAQAYVNGNLITYATLIVQTDSDADSATPTHPYEKSDSYWKIVAFSKARLNQISVSRFLHKNFLFYLIIVGLAFVGSLLLARLQLINRCHEAQRYYEHGFRQILESIDLIAVSLDKYGNIVFCNHYFQGLVGANEDKILNQNWFYTFIEKSKQKQQLAQFQHHFEQQNIAHSECEIISFNDTHHLISWRSTFSYNSENQAETVTFIGSDITEQREIENELLKASSAVEQSPSTVMITNTRGEIEYVNPKFTQLTGYSKSEVLGKNPRILNSGETTAEEYSRLWQDLSEGKQWRGEFHNRKKNGELYWETARISALKDNAGQITHYLAVKEDISEKKRLKAEVEKRNEEIARNKLLAGVGKMANMIAHDLRNPLSSVKMGLQILQNKAEHFLKEEDVELTHIGLEQVHYMESILSDLLTFSRPGELRLEWLSIEKLLEMSISTVQKQLDSYNIQLEIDYQPGLPTIYADKTKLRQVFSNIILNAAQATEANVNGENCIEISTQLKLSEAGPSIEVEIIDNGPGISEDIQDSLFEPFITTKAKGTGLGLAIVKRIIELHQGSINISNGPNTDDKTGAIALINLPISASKEMSDDEQKIQ